MADTPALNELPAFRSLTAHAARIRSSHLRDLFAAEPGRAGAFSAEAHEIHMDFSKQRVDAAVMRDLLALLGETPFAARRAGMFAGEHINVTEDRAVLHVALRAPRGSVIRTDGVDVVELPTGVNNNLYGLSVSIANVVWAVGSQGMTLRLY
jgi:glucose-6-phosphate isomerase